jgi:uncharacterized protein
MTVNTLPTHPAFEPFGRHLPLTLLLLGPFYLNDFANLWVEDWRLWLGIDYLVVKAVPLLVAVWLLRARLLRTDELGLSGQSWGAFFATLAGVTLLGTLIDQNGYALLAALPGYAPLGGMPAITSTAWNWIDLTFGLLLVGLCEELVFRGFLHHLIGRYTQSVWAIVGLSSIAFGLIHWSLGLHAVVVTTLIGAVLMLAYLRTRSLPAIVLAHFAINFIDFSGLVPKSVFQWV